MNHVREKVWKFIETVASAIPLLAVIGIAIWHQISPLEPEKLLGAILSVLFFLTLHVFVQHTRRLGRIEQLGERTVQQLEQPLMSGHLTILGGTDDWYTHMASATRSAAKNVRDASLTSRFWQANSMMADDYKAARKNAIGDKHVNYKYLAVYADPDRDTERLDEVDSNLDKYGWNDSYRANSYPEPLPKFATMFNFVVIDDKETIVAFYSEKTGPTERSVSIQSKAVAELFGKYFDYMFDQSDEFNTQKGKNEENIRAVRDRLSKDRATTKETKKADENT